MKKPLHQALSKLLNELHIVEQAYNELIYPLNQAFFDFAQQSENFIMDPNKNKQGARLDPRVRKATAPRQPLACPTIANFDGKLKD